MATKRQIAANRKNARKGGPKTGEGKAVSSLNARKHGIFASALTKYDQEALYALYEELVEWIKPVGPVEAMLAEMVALNYLRLQRCVRAEAEYHIETWERKGASYEIGLRMTLKDRGQHASWFDAGKFKQSVDLFGRYNTTLTNQVVKLLHELERLRRMRQGEGVPPPMVADVSVDLQMPAVADVGDASPLAPPMAADLTFTAGETEQPPAGAHGGAEEGGIPRVAQAPSPVETPESRSSPPGGRATC